MTVELVNVFSMTFCIIIIKVLLCLTITEIKIQIGLSDFFNIIIWDMFCVCVPLTLSLSFFSLSFLGPRPFLLPPPGGVTTGEGGGVGTHHQLGEGKISRPEMLLPIYIRSTFDFNTHLFSYKLYPL